MDPTPKAGLDAYGSSTIRDPLNSTPLIPSISSNDTTDLEIDSFYFYQAEQFTLLWILFISIVCGNSSVLIALFFSKSNKSRMNYFIKQLAIADLLVGLISVLTDIIWRITVAWYAGHILCKIIRFSQVVVTYSSTYVLVALSIDRYDAIRHPMNFSGSWKRARCLVGSAWIISLIFSIPILVFYEEKTIQGQLQCWIEFPQPWHWQLYMTLVSITLFIIPMIIITSCYTIIVVTIWTKSKVMTPKKRTHRNRASQESDSRRASSRGLIPRAKIKTVKMTFVIVFVFIVCWSPYIVFDLLQVYGYISRTQTNIAVATFIQSLAPLNSAANPIIYCVFSTQICRTLRTIAPFKWFFCWCCRAQPQHANQSQVKSRSNTRSTSMSEILTMNPRKNTTAAAFQNSQKHVQVLLPASVKIDSI